MNRNSMMNDLLGQIMGGAQGRGGQAQGGQASGGLGDLLNMGADMMQRRGASGGNGGLADMLGGLTGGQSGGGLGGALGGLLGGKGGGGLGDMLGGLLGGKGGSASVGGGGLGDLLSGPGGKPGLGHAGAAAILGMLLGSSKTRSLAAKGALVGGLAWLGKMAWDAHRNSGETDAAAPQAQPVHELEGPAAEDRGAAILAAMIAAAKADGHIDDTEKQVILEAAQGVGPEGQAMLREELSKPLDAGEIAGLADSDQARRELYAVSLMVTGDDDPKERAYLDQLADALSLPRSVTNELEAQMPRPV